MGKILQALARQLSKLEIKTQKVKSFRDSLIKKINTAESLSLSQQIKIIQQAYRLIQLSKSHTKFTPEIFHDLLQTHAELWNETGDIAVKSKNIKELALQLYQSSNPQNQEKIILNVSPHVREISEELIKICIENQIHFDLNFEEPHYLAIMLNHLDESRIKQLAELENKKLGAADKIIGVRTNIPTKVAEEINQDAAHLWHEYVTPFQRKIRSGKVYFTNTRIPSAEDAQIDKIPYLEYKKLYFQSCDQPWNEIEKAQAFLIKKFNRANSIHILNSDGTDISFDIKDRSFCNSVIGKNIPGSEIFSAPNLKGTNGIIVANGTHRYKTSPIIKDIILEFKKGECVSYGSKTRDANLKKILEIDRGARFIGEIGFGTNPHLRRMFTNIALVEKVSGSFHVALGNCYTFDTYADQKVNVDNKNRSIIHWDITTLLRGKSGKIFLDDELIQEDGTWLDPKAAVLNLGWGALPKKQQPRWWQKEFPKGYPDLT